MKIILVTVGNYQEYIIDNIKQLLLFNNLDITVITNRCFFHHFYDYDIELMDCDKLSDENFNQHSKLDKEFRNGFWHYCSLRLFYVYSYIKHYDIKECIHLENDVLTYVDFDTLHFKENKVYATFDCDTRVIPSIIYIPNHTSFEPIIKNYSNELTDMDNLAKFNEDVILPFPIYPKVNEITKFNKLYDEFGMIFDAAAMGQYLGGVDPRNDNSLNSIGFVNSTCIIKYNQYKFKWNEENELLVPYLVIDHKQYKICNLHIHCKNLKKFMSNKIDKKNLFLKQYQLFNENHEWMNYVISNEIMVYDKINSMDELLPIHDIHYLDLEFKYMNGLRIPYYNDHKINAIKIKKEDIYNYISCMSLLNVEDIITGEKLQSIADIVIGNQESLSYNPNNVHYSKKMINMNDIDDLDEYTILFVFTHNLEEFYHKFGNQLENKIIISHNSDHEIKEVKNIKYHYAQNCLIQHDQLCPLPIGLQNDQWFDHRLVHDVFQERVTKSKHIYFYFDIHTQISRVDCYEKLKDKLEWNIPRNKNDYYVELAKHKYAICPRGNGLDTHRLWECLYLNVIPIVIKRDFININNLPIIVLNDWSEINTIDHYVFKEQCMDKIRFTYYENKIKNHKI